MIKNRCPACGFDEYYLKVTFSGKGFLAMRYDDRSADNETLFDTVVIKRGKTAFCANCHKVVPRRLLTENEKARGRG